MYIYFLKINLSYFFLNFWCLPQIFYQVRWKKICSASRTTNIKCTIQVSLWAGSPFTIIGIMYKWLQWIGKIGWDFSKMMSSYGGLCGGHVVIVNTSLTPWLAWRWIYLHQEMIVNVILSYNTEYVVTMLGSCFQSNSWFMCLLELLKKLHLQNVFIY